MLTTLVVDKLLVQKGITDRKHPSRKNQELAAGGIANAGVAFFGGIPGAMTTSISILIVNEGGNNRSAAVLTGIFVLVEALLFQDLIENIPACVFGGILVKVRYPPPGSQRRVPGYHFASMPFCAPASHRARL